VRQARPGSARYSSIRRPVVRWKADYEERNTDPALAMAGARVPS